MSSVASLVRDSFIVFSSNPVNASNFSLTA